MKEKIYTIPITDALKEAEFCPFCAMREKLDKESIEYALGPSYMESDIRAISDEKGFCSHHYSVIMKEQNKLGVALMSHTHIKKLISDIESFKSENLPKKKLFKKLSTDSSNLLGYLDKTSKTCYICARIDKTVDRYVDSFFYLYKNDSDIKELFLKSKGLCYTHLDFLLNKAITKMNDKDYNDFKAEVINKELGNLKVLEEDLEFFIKKFDYKYNELPWGDKKDVLERVHKNLK